jgi:c-di-GMP-binding flagellar brake protein YcgR
LLASFALGQSCYRFMSKVIRVGQCELASGQSVAGAVVEWPDGVEKIERRQYFRCNISPNQPVEAALWPGGKTRRPTSPNGNRRVYRGRMVNASLGGVLIRLTRPDDPGLAFGDTIGLEFTLEPGSPLILLDANIRRYTKHHNGMIDVGVKFVGLDFSVIGRKTLTHLSQALARIERHNLRWRKFDVG